jgi:ferredoxin
MKTRIYYFSGTGNSLYVARSLATALGDTEVVSIPKSLGQSLPPVERVGFVFPVYMWGLPLIVDRFCRQFQSPPSTYCFGVATCGGSAGGTLAQLERVLAGRGLTLALGAALKMPGNYTPLYGAPSETTQKKLFSRAREQISALSATIQAGRTGTINRGSWLGRILVSGIVYRLGAKHLPGSDTKFFADSKCNACGLCAKVCPVGNIVLRENRPVWQHHCEQCMACLQWCPQEAIQCGSRTATRRRYRHPDAKPSDFILGG